LPSPFKLARALIEGGLDLQRSFLLVRYYHYYYY